jgi:hypothetical protein
VGQDVRHRDGNQRPREQPVELAERAPVPEGPSRRPHRGGEERGEGHDEKREDDGLDENPGGLGDTGRGQRFGPTHRLAQVVERRAGEQHEQRREQGRMHGPATAPRPSVDRSTSQLQRSDARRETEQNRKGVAQSPPFSERPPQGQRRESVGKEDRDYGLGLEPDPPETSSNQNNA